jgi:predicted NACHT family NTPase
MYNPKVVYKSKAKDGASRPYRLSVEGNIGSGKSTFLKYFQQFNAVETYLVSNHKN